MRVVAAMSGGVDSAVSAARLVDAGHEVVGVHLALSRSAATLRESARGCCTLEDAGDARRVADRLGIPFYVWDLADRFEQEVVDDFIAEYAAGRTHGHADHAEAVPRFAELTGAPVRAVGRGHDDLADGDVVRTGGLELRIVATPGHTSDSISLALPADHALLTGDTVLGRGTTVVAHPDGELDAYLDSLDRLHALTGDGSVTAILPGHGPLVPDAGVMVAYYRTHRAERLDQVRQALADGAASEIDVVEGVLQRVYADVPSAVWPAARMSIRAQLDYLHRER